MSISQTLTFAPSSAATTSFSCHNNRVNINPGVRVRAVATESLPSARRAGSRESESFYGVLRVNYKATATEIKLAYRSLAKVYHPDLSGQFSDGRDFIEIHRAYETLSDPVARQMYDMSIGIGIGELYLNRRYKRAYESGFYPTRNWETDQCW